MCIITTLQVGLSAPTCSVVIYIGLAQTSHKCHMTHTSSEHALTSDNQQGNVDTIVITQTDPTVTVRTRFIICMLWVSVWWVEQGGRGSKICRINWLMRHGMKRWHFVLAQDITSTFSVFQSLLVTALWYVHTHVHTQ